MKRKVIFMFSGQGSQYYQMGKELYNHHKQFRYWMDHCNEIVQPVINDSLMNMIYGDHEKSESFDHLMYTNPALLCIEYCLVKVLSEMDIQPDYLMGYSLGELTASVVSGAVSLEDGLRLVIRIAQLAEEKAPSAGMLAIMKSKMVITEFQELFENCWITGTNFQENFVVCGPPDRILHIQKILHKENITSQLLPVKYGFHTALIETIKDDYKQTVGKINLSEMEIPIVSSLKAEIIREMNEEYFWEVIRYPVNFEKAVEYVLKKGDYFFIDAGPSGSLATFVKYILPTNSNSISLQMINQFGKDLSSVEKLKSHLFSEVC